MVVTRQTLVNPCHGYGFSRGCDFQTHTHTLLTHTRDPSQVGKPVTIPIFNYNLPPEIRFQKKYCIHIATIPGPKKPWDWDSFCWPLIQELLQLEQGIKAFDAVIQRVFLLHAYLILAFSDIPTMALIMCMKGQNGIRPCRICNIKAVCFNTRMNYVPLRRDKISGARPPQ